MKKLILASAIAAALAGGLVHAEDKKPDNEVTFNVAGVSDYRFRGISQTRLKPALQGGVDYVNNPSGFYAGAWASTIKWTKDAGGSGDVEVDLYGGKRGELAKDLAYDLGVLAYVYAGNDLDKVGLKNANTFELYGQLGYGPAYIKYSHAVTNLFGAVDSKNSGYLDIGANIDLTNGWTGNLHVGHQNVRHASVSSYTDWKLGVTKDFGVLTGALAVVGSNADKKAYASPVNGKFTGKTALLLTLSKTF
ncbi:TorF family putative porin [Janthinobacterium fluminis]|uniref:TorF family putative porin n=1 Tax=Janthinobacterium fluminis TaxID=2987524 RepID=A0ABT5K1E1_9BURK|nr:TorF family putative porin [Janthinobacterium fluminis]MDC8758684.1 TorF family putative porin [Janthinobacterium fluminis]